MCDNFNYAEHLKNQYNSKTFKRKQDYIKYNFGKFFSNNKNIKVLEIGPGLGEFIDYLNKKGIEDITIIDNDKDILDYNSKKFKIKKSLFLKSNIKELENILEKYDIIFLTQVLEHVPVNKQIEFISYLYSILNINGKIIITVPNGNNFISVTERFWDITHVCIYTSNSLIQLSQSSGILKQNIILQGYNIPPYEIINIFRIFFQKILHLFILSMYIINGGVYGKILTPNISLIIKK